jgi:hypothetical protein
MSQANKVELPALIMLVPEGSVLPDGFPIKIESMYGDSDIIHSLSRLITDRDNKNRDGAKDSVVTLWMVGDKPLRSSREITKHIDGILFKALLGAPEGDYSSSWMMLTSDLASYDVDQITAHVDMNDPAKQDESKITVEAQEAKFEKHVDDLMDLLSDTDSDSGVDSLGPEGVDDTEV